MCGCAQGLRLVGIGKIQTVLTLNADNEITKTKNHKITKLQKHMSVLVQYGVKSAVKFPFKECGARH